MIIRNYSYSQHSIDATNLLQLGMKRRYEIIHNTFIIGLVGWERYMGINQWTI